MCAPFKAAKNATNAWQVCSQAILADRDRERARRSTSNVPRDPAKALVDDERWASARDDASPQARERCSTAFHPGCARGTFLRARQLRPVAREARDFAKSLHFSRRLLRPATLSSRATILSFKNFLWQNFYPPTACPSQQHSGRQSPLKRETEFRSQMILGCVFYRSRVA